MNGKVCAIPNYKKVSARIGALVCRQLEKEWTYEGLVNTFKIGLEKVEIKQRGRRRRKHPENTGGTVK